MKYKRILLKISGEALLGDQDFGIAPEPVTMIAQEIKKACTLGAQVAVVVQVADDVFSDDELLIRKVVVGQLLVQVVLEGFLMDYGRFVNVVVAAVVVGLQLVGIVVQVLFGQVVVDVELVVLAEIDFVVVVVVVFSIVGRVNGWLVVLIVVVLVRLFQGRVDFKLLLDALLEFHDGQLQQFHQLDLLRRQFQLLPLGLSQSLGVHLVRSWECGVRSW